MKQKSIYLPKPIEILDADLEDIFDYTDRHHPLRDAVQEYLVQTESLQEDSGSAEENWGL